MVTLTIFYRVTCRGATLARSLYVITGKDKNHIRRLAKERARREYRPTDHSGVQVGTSFQGYHF